MQIIINQRSGVVAGLIEAVVLFIFSPIITRGTNHIYNYVTTRRVFSGKPVKITDTSMSVEDVIPRTFRLFHTILGHKKTYHHSARPDSVRQMLTLTISLFMTTGILLLGIFTDGETVTVHEGRQLLLWNGGKFVDTTESGQNGRAEDILGMAAVRSACVERVRTGEFNLYAVGFFDKQNFEGGRTANSSVCIDGLSTSQKIGIKVSTNTIFNPPADPVYKEDMEGEPATFTFLSGIDRDGSPDFCRVTINTAAASEDWTVSYQDQYRTRFATRATRRQNGSILLRAGVAYHNLNSDEAMDTYTSEDCENFSADMFAGNRFRATLSEIGVRQDLQKLELVVADMMVALIPHGYGRVESQEVMLRAYYAGRRDSEEDVGQDLGTFEARDIDLRTGERQVTVMSQPAVIGLALTLAGTLALLVVRAVIRPVVQVTSPAYVSALYRSDRIQDGLCFQPQEVDIVGVTRQGGRLHIGPVLEGDEIARFEPGVPIGQRDGAVRKRSCNHSGQGHLQMKKETASRGAAGIPVRHAMWKWGQTSIESGESLLQT